MDASVTPTVTTGNFNAPTIMTTEKGAGMIPQGNAQGGRRSAHFAAPVLKHDPARLG